MPCGAVRSPCVPMCRPTLPQDGPCPPAEPRGAVGPRGRYRVSCRLPNALSRRGTGRATEHPSHGRDTERGAHVTGTDTVPFVAQVVWSPDLLGYDFGHGHPMSPTRLDLTMRLVRARRPGGRGRRDVPGHRRGARPGARPGVRRRGPRGLGAGGGERLAGAGHRGRPGVRRDARGRSTHPVGLVRGRGGRLVGARAARREHRGGHAPRPARGRVGLLHLQRRGGRGPSPARRRRPARRVRRPRRSPRRRGRVDLLGRPARPDRLGPPERRDALPRHGARDGHGWRLGVGHRGQPRPAPTARAGCGPSTRSSRPSCARSGRR